MADKKIIETNRHLNTQEKRVNLISKSVYASQRIEGVNISRREARRFAEQAEKNTKSSLVKG